MEQGDGLFLLSEKTKLYTNLQGGEAELWENYLKALPVQLKEARMKDRKQMLFLIDNPKIPPIAITGKLYTLRHPSTNRDPGNFGSRIILWNANPVTADATGRHRQLFRTLCRDRRHPLVLLTAD